MSESIDIKKQQVTQHHQAFLNRRREQLRGQLAKIAEVTACRDATAIKKREVHVLYNRVDLLQIFNFLASCSKDCQQIGQGQ